MRIADIVLMGLSILGCLASVFAVQLVHWNLKREQRKKARERARELDRFEFTMEELNKSIAAAKLMAAGDCEQIVYVKGIRRRQDNEKYINRVARASNAQGSEIA